MVPWFFGSSCKYMPVMNKGAPNIKIMWFWEDTEWILNYDISWNWNISYVHLCK